MLGKSFPSVESSSSTDDSWQAGSGNSSQHYETPDLSQEAPAEALDPKSKLLWRFVESPHTIGPVLLDPLPYEQQGWCQLVNRQTNKRSDKDLPLAQRQGYIQLSCSGQNHVCVPCLSMLQCPLNNHGIQFALLHHAVALLGTRSFQDVGIEDGSHLCGHSVCKTVGHVVWERKELNQARKGCLVWVDCPHEGCELKVSACRHQPPCLKSIPGVAWADFSRSPGQYIH